MRQTDSDPSKSCLKLIWRQVTWLDQCWQNLRLNYSRECMMILCEIVWLSWTRYNIVAHCIIILILLKACSYDNTGDQPSDTSKHNHWIGLKKRTKVCKNHQNTDEKHLHMHSTHCGMFKIFFGLLLIVADSCRYFTFWKII